jgi:acyl-CoA synthetase (AMP-forming)/AMP-acid ligase II
MPIYHSTATILGFAPCLFVGSTYAIGHRFSNKTFWPEVRASRATVIQYVGETCRYLLVAPPLLDPVTGENLDKKNNVRIAFGNGLRPDIWENFKERFGIATIAEFYGATEGVSGMFNIASNTFSTGAIGRYGTVARLFIRGKMEIVEVDIETEQPLRDPANHHFCRKVDTNVPGELIQAVDPANVALSFQGYFGNQKATSSKILRDVLKQGDAWFRTGDMVRMDAEGRMWFCDRIGDTFRYVFLPRWLSPALFSPLRCRRCSFFSVPFFSFHGGRPPNPRASLRSIVPPILFDFCTLHVVVERSEESSVLVGGTLCRPRWFIDNSLLTPCVCACRWKGENVSTNEVGELLSLHPAVLDANVYGVSLPHHDGRAGCCAVLLDTADAPSAALLRDLADHAKSRLPKYAVPLFLRVTRETQATGNNKRQKHVLRSQGVDLAQVGARDRVYWLKGGVAAGGGYVPFTEADWKAMSEGAVKL